MKTTAIAIAALIISATAQANGIDVGPSGPPSGMAAFILTYGTYTQVQHESTNQMAGGFTAFGIQSQKLLHQSEQISAESGTVMGVEFGTIRSATNLSEILTFEITPPRTIRNPETGTEISRFTFTRTIAQTQQNPFIGYSFDQHWENESGIWLFQVRYRDNVLVEKQLTVHFPERSKKVEPGH